ncbi:MAG: hypothetical protein IK123_08295 [Lachnospiraceae bacterium]|nr:hypothetical protein [Lachnospiraceae bacterium]
MGDTLGKIFVGLFGCVLMFIVPVLLAAQKQDTVAQQYIDNAVVEFVDNARAAGKITPAAYEKLCRNVDMAHLICEIRITHSAAYTVPTNVIDPDTGFFETVTYRNDFIKEDILAQMYPDVGDDRDYQMKNGDYLKVEVQNVSPTLGSRMLRIFTTNQKDSTLFASYGGYVGNNKQ